MSNPNQAEYDRFNKGENTRGNSAGSKSGTERVVQDTRDKVDRIIRKQRGGVMSRLTVGDLLKLPEAVLREIENRQYERSQVIANNLVNRLTGSSLQVDSMTNRYASQSQQSIDSQKSSNNRLGQYLDEDIYQRNPDLKRKE